MVQYLQAAYAFESTCIITPLKDLHILPVFDSIVLYFTPQYRSLNVIPSHQNLMVLDRFPKHKQTEFCLFQQHLLAVITLCLKFLFLFICWKCNWLLTIHSSFCILPLCRKDNKKLCWLPLLPLLVWIFSFHFTMLYYK